MSRKKYIIAAVVVAIASMGSSCEHKPKERFVDRVAHFCGQDVADRYAQIPWVDRDYAADNILITCVLWPGELNASRVEKDQVGG